MKIKKNLSQVDLHRMYLIPAEHLESQEPLSEREVDQHIAYIKNLISNVQLPQTSKQPTTMMLSPPEVESDITYGPEINRPSGATPMEELSRPSTSTQSTLPAQYATSKLETSGKPSNLVGQQGRYETRPFTRSFKRKLETAIEPEDLERADKYARASEQHGAGFNWIF
jgi:hypothetical protein